jgi:diadenosine tetraphosphatase ApaH/serine/threonine PP2A family protein phosphatase
VFERLSARRIALFGGVYANWLALEAAIDDARARGAEALYCLGDLGGFGPQPDRVFPLLRDHGVRCLQGNYDLAIAGGHADCGCGYADPRDNHFALISYRYTLRHTSSEHRRWLGALPSWLALEVGGHRVFLCHGSPRQLNEFLWDSTTPTALLERFCRERGADVLGVTHTGLGWQRALGDGRHAVNVGALGRPANDGTRRVWYTLLTAAPDLEIAAVPVEYDAESLARAMEREALPAEFVETIRTGWWTCCLEALPAKERARGRY